MANAMGFPRGAIPHDVTIATGDSVTLEYIGRLDEDGSLFDTSREALAEETGLAEAQPDREYAPITVEVGSGDVIEGIDEGLVGLEAGETSVLTIPPAKAYGEWTEEHVQTFETDRLRDLLDGQTPEEGAVIEAENGQRGTVSHVDEETVRVDFNPDLAGETLEFEIEIVDVDRT